jgi:DNA polymerase III subunit alpha
VVQAIVQARTEKGPFQSFTDFCRKVESGVLHKKCLESLILAGAFDSLGYRRRALLEGYAKVVEPVLADRRAEAVGQESFFGGGVGPLLAIDETVLDGEEFDRPDFLRNEKDVLGQYVTDHPLLPVKDALAAQTDMEMAELPSLGDGDILTVAGIVGAVARRYTKRGEPYAVFRLEDLTGGVAIVAFPSVFDKVGYLLGADRILMVKGRADLRGRELQLVALEISQPDLTLAPGPDPSTSWPAERGSGAGATPGGNGGPLSPSASDPLVVDVPEGSCTGGLLARLKDLLATYHGEVPVVVRLVSDGSITRLRLGEGFRVNGSGALLSELERLLGRGAARLEPAGSNGGLDGGGSTPAGVVASRPTHG